MKVLITGIDGFVAPHLARLLCNKHSVYGTYFIEPKNRIENIVYRKMDIIDQKQVSDIISEIMPDIIYHLAGLGSVSESWKNPEMAFKANADGTRNLLESVAKAKIHPRILIISSAEVYGNPVYLPMDEKHPLNPQSPYGISKLQLERNAANYPELPIILARSFNHTGPGQTSTFVCSAFAQQIAKIEKGQLEPVILHGNLSLKRDFSDVRDIVRAYEALIEKGKSGEAYNVCSGKLFTLAYILDTLISFSSKEIKKSLDSSRLRKDDIPVLYGDNSKLVNTTSWQPEIDFKQTLKDLLAYWRENT